MRLLDSCIVFGVFAAITLAACWPLPLHLGTHIANDPIDPLLNAWVMWWTASVPPWDLGWWSPGAFAPMSGALALSEHLLGLLWISVPVRAMGGSPALAANIALLLSFALSGLTMFLLVNRLTGSRSAAFVSGCLFAFAPYRLVHLAHIQTLSVYAGPIVLFGLHRYLETPRWRWAGLSAAAWGVLALTSGYHLVHFTVIAAAWAFWFIVGPRRLATAGPLAAAWLVAALVIAWPTVGYQRIHAEHQLRRTPGEIEVFSAKVEDVLRAPAPSRFWGHLDDQRTPEAALFPGLALPAVFALWVATRHQRLRPVVGEPPPPEQVLAGGSWVSSIVALVIAAVAGAVALTAALAPFTVTVLGGTLSLTRPAKSGGVACAALCVAVLLSPPVRLAWRRGSVVPFYLLAGAGTWLLALGPTIRFADTRLWYYAPYAWLSALPGGAALRVPARFWLWTVCLLAVAAGCALASVQRRLGRIGGVVMVGLAVLAVADGWPRAMQVVPLPAPPPASWTAADGRVLELPAGDGTRDMAAVYRSIQHRRPVVNGYSGYVPRHYQMLLDALRERDSALFAALTRDAPLHVHIDASVPEAGEFETIVREAGGRPAGAHRADLLFVLPARPPGPPAPADGRTLAVATVHGLRGEGDITPLLTDSNPSSRWHTDGPQDQDDGVVVTLAGRGTVQGIRLFLGAYAEAYPRDLVVEVQGPASPDWHPVWEGRTAGLAIAAVIDAPQNPTLTITWPAIEAHLVRLRAAASHPTAWWSIAGLEVVGRRR